MANRANRLKLAALAAALVLAVSPAGYGEGWDNPGWDSGGWNNPGPRNHLYSTFSLSAATPPDAVLRAFGFGDVFWSPVRFGSIVEAGGGGYLGWTLAGEGWGDVHLVMAWSERSIAQANVIVFAAHDIFGGVMDRWSSGGIHFASGDGWTLTLNSQRIDDGHYYWPAGTVLLWISAGN